MVMTVVHDYFRRNSTKNDKRSFMFFWTGFPDARPILHPTGYLFKNMGNTEKTQTKDPKLEKEDVPAQNNAEDKPETKGTFQLEGLKRIGKAGCCMRCFEILFIALCILCMLQSLAEIIVAVSTAISTRLFSSEQSGRLVGMVILALLAAVTISILVYAVIAVFKKHQRPLHAAALVLLLTAILQAVVVGLAVRMTEPDELVLVRSLQESFGLAREANSRHVQLWSSTQNELNCCGLYGPEDYRPTNFPGIFPPNVPISCCTTYDSSRSDLVQERERQACRARQTYYTVGCKGIVVESFQSAADLVLGLTSSLIVLEIILAILALILLRRMKPLKCENCVTTVPKSI